MASDNVDEEAVRTRVLAAIQLASDTARAGKMSAGTYMDLIAQELCITALAMKIECQPLREGLCRTYHWVQDQVKDVVVPDAAAAQKN